MKQGRVDHSVIENLRRLQKNSGKNLFGDLLLIFQRDAPKRIADMEQALIQNDLEKVAELAHKLKSSSGNIGAKLISDLSSEVEELIVDKEVTELQRISPLVSEIKSNLEQTIAEIRAA